MNGAFDTSIKQLQQNGGRITEQRKQLLSLILAHPEYSCKEIYYLARKADSCIGRATIYRFVHDLESCGLLRHQNVIVTETPACP